MCIDSQMLSAYLDGELPEPYRTQVEEHLEHCAACRKHLEDMKALALKNRTIAVLGNGSWAPQSDKIMRNYLSDMKDMDVSEKSVVIKSRLKPEQSDELEEVVGDIVSRLSEN